MADSSLDRVLRVVEEQHRRNQALRRVISACSEELEVLRHCLSEAGVVRNTAFLVQLQRHRFAAAQAAHPFDTDAAWDNAFNINEIAFPISLLVGAALVPTISVVSKSIRGSLAKVWPLVKERCSCRIYVCGGHDGMQPLNSAVMG